MPYLVKAKCGFLYACEWNPHAADALRKNLVANGVGDRCNVYQGDNAQVAPKGVADRINLGLIPSSENGWPVAAAALRPDVGGWMHVHDNVTTTAPPASTKTVAGEWIAQEFTVRGNVIAARLKVLLEEAHGGSWTTVVNHVEKVKSYAPRVYHLVYDIHCAPAPANPQSVLGHNPGVRLFVCGQQTSKMQLQIKSLVAGKVMEGRIKAATPPFNVRDGVVMREDCTTYNVPVFGPAIANAVMALFAGDAMETLAGELGVKIPAYQFSTFVQGKAHKIQTLVDACRARDDCKREGSGSEQNAAAVDRLAKFVSDFQDIGQGHIQSKGQWHAFVDTHVACSGGGWESKLHFDHILTHCFGFEAETAAEIRATKHDASTTLEQHSLRWLSSALLAFGPEGCLGDLVNLVVAMHSSTMPVDVSQRALVGTLTQFGGMLKSGDAAQQLCNRNIWVPTHLVHDAESDDTLAWLMLEHVRRLLGLPQLQTVVQLPEDPVFDKGEEHFLSKGSIVFRDADSENAEAVAKNIRHLL